MKVLPKIKTSQDLTLFEDLADGDVFLFTNKGLGLWIKTEDLMDKQLAVNVETGEEMFDLCEQWVVKVEATVTWKYIVEKRAKE